MFSALGASIADDSSCFGSRFLNMLAAFVNAAACSVD